MRKADVSNHPAYHVMRYLQDGSSAADFERILQNHCIRCHQMELGTEIAAFVYKSAKRYHIVVNSRYSIEQQRIAFLHELHHIMEDCPSGGQLIGFDTLYSQRERLADAFAQVASTMIPAGTGTED